MSKGVIYRAVCLVNGKSYIGQTSRNFKQRVSQHKTVRNGGKFGRAIRKYGFGKFVFGIIGQFESDQLNNLEMYYILRYDTYKNGYNSTEGGDGIRGFKHNHETKMKLSLGRAGKYIGKDNPNYGNKYTEETLQKMRGRSNFLGKKHTLTHRFASSKRQGAKWFDIINNGLVIDSHFCVKYVAEIHGLDHACIRKCLKGQRNKHKGYEFRFQ